MNQGIMTNEEFKERFGDEDGCRVYLFDARWPEGFVCPRCGFRAAPFEISSRGKLQCRRCKGQTSLTSGTIMEKTRTPLTKWFLAIYLLVRDGRDMTVQKLSQEIGVASDTAWHMSSKIRRALAGGDDGGAEENGEFNIAKSLERTFIEAGGGSLPENFP